MAIRWEDRKRRRTCYITYWAHGRRVSEKVGAVPFDASDRKRERIEKKAAGIEAQRLIELDNGTWVDPRAERRKGMSFEDLVKKFLKDYRSRQGRIAYYEQRSEVWLAYLKGKPADQIQTPDIDALVRARRKKVSGSTIRKDLISLSTLFRWAKARGYVTGNPADSDLVKRPPASPKRPNPLTQADEEKLIAASIDWLRPMIRWAINTGMDKGEILNLTWKGIDRSRKPAIVTVARAKTGVEREIALNATLERVLEEAGRIRRTDTNRVFLSGDGRVPAEQAVKAAMRRAWGSACPEKTRPWKSLRATFASRLDAAGASVPTIAALMGLTSAHVLDHYVKPHGDQLQAAMESLDSLEEAGQATG